MNNEIDQQRDDMQDRLMDLALQEKLGGKRPPDIASRIGPGIPKEHRRTVSAYKLAIATMLLVCASVVGMSVWGPSMIDVAYYRPATKTKTTQPNNHSKTSGHEYDAELDTSDYTLKADNSVRGPWEVDSRSIPTPPDHEFIDDPKRAPAALMPVADAEMSGTKRGSGLYVRVGDRSVQRKRKSEEQPTRVTSAFKGDSGGEGEYHPEGRGPGQRGDQHAMIVDNPLRRVADEPLSTFSIDVDTAAYSKLRSLLASGQRPSPETLQWLRVEEMINYFGYNYPAPRTGEPFSVNIETAACPWAEGRRLVRIGLKGREIDRRERPPGNFVFLLDVSGSMTPPNRLPLVLEGMRLLTRQLDERDRVAIVVYAGASGMVLPSTPATHEGKQEILSALSRLHSGGSTNGAAGIELAYQIAQDNFIKDGANRVILCTDGDFNVGVTSPDRLENLITEKAKTGVFLTTLGFGMGNHNDAMLEKLADKGNGVYGYIDDIAEAKKLFVEELSGTLVTVAKDVKIQVEFNPVHVTAYRLIGYENRVLAKEDFNDDKKDAGEIGAGHTVTALYEIVPAALLDKSAVPPDGDKPAVAPKVDDLEFQKPGDLTDAARQSGQTLAVKLRYKEPAGDTSKLIKVGVADDGKNFSRASADFKFAAAVASFGMLLRDSPHKGTATYDAVLEIARSALGEDKHGYRAEFTRLVEQAKTLGR